MGCGAGSLFPIRSYAVRNGSQGFCQDLGVRTPPLTRATPPPIYLHSAKGLYKGSVGATIWSAASFQSHLQGTGAVGGEGVLRAILDDLTSGIQKRSGWTKAVSKVSGSAVLPKALAPIPHSIASDREKGSRQPFPGQQPGCEKPVPLP